VVPAVTPLITHEVVLAFVVVQGPVDGPPVAVAV
jgi:hypothetical protein